MFCFLLKIQTAVILASVCVVAVLEGGAAHGNTSQSRLKNPFTNDNSTVVVCCKYGGWFTSWFSGCCRKRSDITGVCTRLCDGAPALYAGPLGKATLTATLPYKHILVAEYTLTTHNNEITLRIHIKPGIYHDTNGNRYLLDFLKCVNTSSSATQCLHNLITVLQESKNENYIGTTANDHNTFETSTTTSTHSTTTTEETVMSLSISSSTASFNSSTEFTTSARNVTLQPSGLNTTTTTSSHYTGALNVTASTLQAVTSIKLSTPSRYAVTSMSQTATSVSTPSPQPTVTKTLQKSVSSMSTTSPELTNGPTTGDLTTVVSTSTSTVTTSNTTSTESEIIPSAESVHQVSPTTRLVIGVVVGSVLVGITLSSVIVVMCCIFANTRKPDTPPEDSVYNDSIPQKITTPPPINNPLYGLHPEDLAVMPTHTERGISPNELRPYQSHLTDDVTSLSNDDQEYASLGPLTTPTLFSNSSRSSICTTYDTLDHVSQKATPPMGERHVYSRLRDEFAECGANDCRQSGDYDRLKLK